MTSKKRLLLSVASFFILVAISGIASAQSSKEAEGEAAERAGRLREALTNYTTALQATTPGSDAEQRLLERAAAISSKVSPLPALPAEAERRLVRGQALVESARDADAFMRAAAEFRAALRAAPWLADAHYNLGIVLDKAQRFSEAIRSLKLSILAAPNAKDAGEAQRLIYRIEVRQEEAQRAKADAERKALDGQRALAEKRPTSNLAGYWRDSVGSRYLFKADGNSFTMTRVMGCWTPAAQDFGNCPDLRPDNTLLQFGTINNDSLSGHSVNLFNHSTRRVTSPSGSFACPVAAGNYPIIRSEISADGTRLKIIAQDTPQNPNCPPFGVGGEYRREQ